MGASALHSGRDDYDRCPFQGQRQDAGRAMPLRGTKPAPGDVAGGSKRDTHGSLGGARAFGKPIEPNTYMRPLLQYGHRWMSRAATRSQKSSTDSAVAGATGGG